MNMKVEYVVESKTEKEGEVQLFFRDAGRKETREELDAMGLTKTEPGLVIVSSKFDLIYGKKNSEFEAARAVLVGQRAVLTFEPVP